MNSAARHVPDAASVQDRDHVSAPLNEAVDQVRRAKPKQLMAQGDETLKGTRPRWLCHPQNFNEDQAAEFAQRKDLELKVARARAAKELFSQFWEYDEEGWARRFFRDGFGWVSRSRLQPLVEVAHRLKRHWENLVTYIRHRITKAVTEGLNSKTQHIKAKAKPARRSVRAG
jgi:transposase